MTNGERHMSRAGKKGRHSVSEPAATGTPLDRKVDEFHQLGLLRTQLRGFLYWATECDRLTRLTEGHRQRIAAGDRSPELMAAAVASSEKAVWYRDAFLLSADALFTSDRGGDPLDGSALRALRDLGYSAQLEHIQKALSQRATSTGHSLNEAIRRFRSEFVVHSSYRLAEHASGMGYLGWGEKESEEYLIAAQITLVTAVEQVVAFLDQARRDRFSEFPAEQVEHLIGSSTSEGLRARAREYRRQRE